MESKSLTIQHYLDLLKKAYESISIAEDRTVTRFTRILYLAAILIFWVLAYNIPEYREMFSVGILFVGFFLLMAIFRTNIKKRRQKRAQQPFDRMIYQLSEVSKVLFEVGDEGLTITLTRKDQSTRELDYSYDKLTAYQWLGRAFLLSNEEQVDFIIPEGALKTSTYHTLSEQVKGAFDKKEV